MSENKYIPWKMLSYTHFTKEVEGYVIDLRAGSPNHWDIMKDGVIVDRCYYYSPMNGEANGKVQSERILNKILQNNLNNVEKTNNESVHESNS